MQKLGQIVDLSLGGRTNEHDGLMVVCWTLGVSPGYLECLCSSPTVCYFFGSLCAVEPGVGQVLASWANTITGCTGAGRPSLTT